MEIQYLKRNIDEVLLGWIQENPPDRKPLLIRGARQVGKSSALRHLGKQFKHYIEINFDEDKDVGTFFDTSLSPQKICEKLALYYHTPIIPGETLLFFDEIQNCQSALSKLRYFYEKYAELHVAAAGSLLEFALEEIPSFGVGRIRSLFMYPFSFNEFLCAINDEGYVEEIKAASPDKPIDEPIHKLLLDKYKTFLICGGMPEVVSQYAQKQDLLNSELILTDLLTVFKTDFAKYHKRATTSSHATGGRTLLLLNEVFESVMQQTDGKFVYERAAPGTPSAAVRQALELLIMAGLVSPCYPYLRKWNSSWRRKKCEISQDDSL